MKTLTEFNVTHFKRAEEIRAGIPTEGKSPEELQQAFGDALKEQLKLEGDKLTHFLSAAELLANKTTDLKRVVVFTLGEGEKAPSGTREKDGTHFLTEYYPPIQKKGAEGGRFAGRQGRGSGRGGDRDKKKGRRGGRGRDPRREQGGAPGTQGEQRTEGRRPPRGDRGPRPGHGTGSGPAPAPAPGTGKIIPRPRPSETPVGAQAAAPVATSQETADIKPAPSTPESTS